MVTYSFLETPTPNQIKQIILLYRMEGWWTEPTDDFEHIIRIINGSHCFMVAASKDKIIGMGRTISDRTSDAYIQDVTVTSSYRRQGIGTQIVKSLIARLQADEMRWIGVIADRGTHGFYKQFGFEPMPEATPMLYNHRLFSYKAF